MAVRIVTVARDAELWSRRRRLAGDDGGAVAAPRPGYDPAVVDALVPAASAGWPRRRRRGCGVLDAEPTPMVTIDRRVSTGRWPAIADFADIKSPWLRGHSTGVADLVAAAGTARRPVQRSGDGGGSGCTASTTSGSVGVPNGIWDPAGPLSAEQWERVRLHPYLSERVLQRLPMLAPLADRRGGPPRARRRLRIPPGLHAAEQVRAGTARRGRRLPRDDRGPSASAGAERARMRRRSCAPTLEAGRFGHAPGRRGARRSRRGTSDGGRPPIRPA